MNTESFISVSAGIGGGFFGGLFLPLLSYYSLFFLLLFCYR